MNGGGGNLKLVGDRCALVNDEYDACEAARALSSFPASPSSAVEILSVSSNDGICDDDDNCPNDSNSNQNDIDRDGVGDICDSVTENYSIEFISSNNYSSENGYGFLLTDSQADELEASDFTVSLWFKSTKSNGVNIARIMTRDCSDFWCITDHQAQAFPQDMRIITRGNDIIHNNKSIKDMSGRITLQQKIVDTFKNFKPDIVILGHADRVKNDTLQIMKEINSSTKFSQWFLDPLSKYGPDHENNTRRILDKVKLLDNTFLTTEPSALQIKIPNSFFMPNPADKAFEVLNNYNKNCPYDVFFAMSHGVHRGQLKSGKGDDRETFINKLIKLNKNIKFDVYGMNNVQPIWADQFIKKISNSYMGLNLSRGKPIKYYSSDRIVQLVGNGLLTFIDKNTYLSDFFTNDEIVFYKNISDLSYKLNKYKKDKKNGKKIARLGKIKYLKYFNSDIVSEYILSKSFDFKVKKQVIWS